MTGRKLGERTLKDRRIQKKQMHGDGHRDGIIYKDSRNGRQAWEQHGSSMDRARGQFAKGESGRKIRQYPSERTGRNMVMQKNTGKKKRKSESGKILFCSAILLIFLFAALGPFSALIHYRGSVVEANQQLGDIQYKVIQVESGDSLWSIARENMNPGFSDIREYISEIRRCNQLEDDHITLGNYLMIPYYENLSLDSVASGD